MTWMTAMALSNAPVAYAQEALVDHLNSWETRSEEKPPVRLTAWNDPAGKLALRPIFAVGGTAGAAIIPTQYYYPGDIRLLCPLGDCAPTNAGPSRTAGWGFGVYGRVGVHLDDVWGVSGGLTAGLSDLEGLDLALHLRGSATLEITPTDAVTLAVGPMLGGFNDSGANDTSYAGAAARLDIHLRPQRMESGLRRAVTIGLELACGWDLVYACGNDTGATGAVLATVGYAFY